MPTGIIEINKLRLRAYHGVLEQERIVGNIFEVTVHLKYPMDKAMVTDNIITTINYVEVVDVIRNEMKQPSNLLESVAGRLKSAIIRRFPMVQGGRIKIAKLTPPIDCEVDSIAVNYKW